jgi:hypothetical protein
VKLTNLEQKEFKWNQNKAAIGSAASRLIGL